jgi:hypothetical protein
VKELQAGGLKMFQRGAFGLLVIALIALSLILYVTFTQTTFFPKALLAHESECPATLYYPADARPVIDEFEADWFAGELLAFHEEPLFPIKDQDQLSLRFTYMRSFHASVMVRTVETNGDIRLIAKWMAGEDGCSNGTPACTINRILTKPEQTRLKAAAAPLLRKPSFGCYGGFDGSRWVVEASGRGEYRLWNQWSPEMGEVRDLGLTMLDLTGWRLDPVY